tara:strand:+ start:329 stop:901 length:573 start_codon:yes stop_codon:yes gene_type:complete
MITCIVNPSRCGSTWLQHIIDKHFMLTGLNDYSMEYEIIDHANGMHVIDNPPSKNFLFKYQYLYANKPLLGADKYIVLDRRDLDAWIYSSYMSFQNHHPHGKAPVHRTFDHAIFNQHKDAMMMLREKSWEPEKARLISHGAISLVYEDIKDLSSTEILKLCGYEDATEFDTNDLYFRGIKLEPVWSCKGK